MKSSKPVVWVWAVIAVAATSAYGTPWTWTNLDYPGAEDTQAWGISGNNVVGQYWDSNSNNAHGFLYNGTTWTSLDYPGASDTWVSGISGNNIVGQHSDSSSSHGFLYDGATWTSLDYPGVSGDTRATGISGNNIVGNHYGVSGYHGFLLTIPEPATLSLLAFGGLAMMRRRR